MAALSVLNLSIAPVGAQTAQDDSIPSAVIGIKTKLTDQQVKVVLAEVAKSGVLTGDDFKAFSKALWRSDNQKPNPWEKGFDIYYDQQNASIYPERNRVVAVLSKLRSFATQDLSALELNDARVMANALQNWMASPYFARKFATAVNGNNIVGQQNACAVPINNAPDQQTFALRFLKEGSSCGQ